MGSKLLEIYTAVFNWIRVCYLLAISSICEFTRRSINFVLALSQVVLDVDFLLDISIRTGVH